MLNEERNQNSFEPFPPLSNPDSLYKSITVYQNGECLVTYEGELKIISNSNNQLIFIDEDGNKVIINNNDGIIIIEYEEAED